MAREAGSGVDTFTMRDTEEDTLRGGHWVSAPLTLMRNETLPLLSSQSQGREEVQKNKRCEQTLDMAAEETSRSHCSGLGLARNFSWRSSHWAQ